MKRGDLVSAYFDTGAFGTTIMFGIVTACGPKMATIRWESGASNRIRHGSGAVALISDADLRAEARKKLRLHGN